MGGLYLQVLPQVPIEPRQPFSLLCLQLQPQQPPSPPRRPPPPWGYRAVGGGGAPCRVGGGGVERGAPPHLEAWDPKASNLRR